jgi:hypothetical protein
MGSVIRFKGNRLDPQTLRALVAGTLIQGNKLSGWWSKQSADFLDSFMREIRTSMQNGESVTQAITRVTGGTLNGVQVPGIMKKSKGQAGALVSTAMNRVSNEAALASYQANSDVIKWVTQLSTLDNRTSDICVAYSGQTWDLDTLQPVNGSTLPFNGGPPRHFNCRSRLRPVTKSFRELGVDADEIPRSTRASMDGQVPADITFDQFLKNKGVTFQNKLLGQGRAELWRKKQITLTDLVDMRGNPLSLRQLEQLTGITPAPAGVVKGPPRITSMDDDKYVELFVGDEDVRKVFTTNRADKGDRLVMIHRDILEDGWSKTDGYIPPDLSRNTIGKRIKGFEDFLKDNNVIRVGNVFVDPEDGRIAFGDGRHRARVLLNRGMTRIPVSMSDDSLAALQKHYRTSFGKRKALTDGEIKRFEELERQMEKARRDRLIAERERRRAAQEPPKPKMVDSFLDDVKISEADFEEITGHAKRLFTAAKQADELVTQQITDLAKSIGADFPEGSLKFRLKDVNSTARKIQTYARDRNLTFSEAADQLSDSLRYTYIVEENTYVSAVMQAMEEFAELGYRNGKFDAAWLKRPDYKGLNVNLVTPEGVRLELQFHTARSFDVKQNINHALYEKFRKLSPAKQKGREGQQLQAEMLENAQSIPIPRNINDLEDLAKIYNNPSPADQKRILDLGKQRKEIKERSLDPVDVAVVEGPEAPQAAKNFLIQNGFTEAEIVERGIPVDFITKFEPKNARAMLDQMRKYREAKEELALARQKFIDELPTEIPVFKNNKEAKKWFEDNIVNTVQNQIVNFGKGTGFRTNPKTGEIFSSPVQWSTAYEAEMSRIMAEAIIEVSKRFNLKTPDFIGNAARHPTLKFKRSGKNELASVHMDSDSLLVPTNQMKQVNKALDWQSGKKYAKRDYTEQVLRLNRIDSFEDLQKQTKKSIEQAKKMVDDGVPHAKELVKSLEAQLERAEYGFTVSARMRLGELSQKQQAFAEFWETIIHEHGHRFHQAYKTEIDNIVEALSKESATARRLWAQSVSPYAGENNFEFIAETFTRYMIGDHDSVYPPLLEFFKSLDKSDRFGIENLSKLFLEAAVE